MKRLAIGVVAFCTIAAFLFPAGGPVQAAREEDRALSAYKAEKLSLCAQDFPVLAQIHYHHAIQSLNAGDKETAEKLLHQAIELQPTFADAYFTLARLKALSLDTDAILYLHRACFTLLKSFHYQSLLAANLVLFAILLLIIVAIVVGIAMVMKYLPFSAHRLRELLQSRFNAAHNTLAAYLILLIPFALFPGFITGFAIMLVITWIYLSRREKALVFILTTLLILTGFFANTLKMLTPVTNPHSLTATVAAANSSPGTQSLIRMLEKRPAGHPDLKINKNLSLGLLNLRNDDLFRASDYFLKTISSDQRNALAYINLGNVYYLQGEYEKALEGYIKAEALDSLNAVGQYNLGQAYIKTLLLKKSTDALSRASAAGIEEVKSVFAGEALGNIQVFPALFPDRELWRMALIEGRSSPDNFILDIFIPLAHFPPQVSAWILLIALVTALIAGRAAQSSWLTFQCSNCGKLTCSGCCNSDRSMIICGECAKTIEGISSDKVIDALLRQRRQARLVKRGKAIRFLVCWLPGMRNIYHNNLFGGVNLAMLFGISCIGLWSRGLIIEDWSRISYGGITWHVYLPAAGLLLSYIISTFKTLKQKQGKSQSPALKQDQRKKPRVQQRDRRRRAVQ